MKDYHPRNKYDTFIVWLYSQRKEDILPLEFRRSIAYSTSSAWRHMDYSLYVGSEFRNIQQQSLEYYELFQRYRNLKKTFYIISKVWVAVSDKIIPVIRKQKEHQELFLDQLQKLMPVLNKKIVLKIAGISASAFHYRVNKLRFKCSGSQGGLCFKKHPLQISSAEIKKMKAMLTDQRFLCWPIASITLYAKRFENLHVGLATWYKYVKLFDIRRFKSFAVKKLRGIVSSAPNEFLHVDTTLWELANNKKAAIAIVSDNFSKAVLGWSISMSNAAPNVIAALNMAFSTIRKTYPDKLQAKLIADGGTENNASSVISLLQNTDHPDIIKLIAQKDIAFSNSPIEAINKIAKKYLRFYYPTTLSALTECFEKNMLQDYNCIRPHYSLNGLTPMEAYMNNIQLPALIEEAVAARALRMEDNRKNACGIC